MAAEQSDTASARHEHAGPCVAKAGDYQVIACANCGFCHVLPLPSSEELALAYREQYYREEKPDYLSHAGEDQAWATLMQTDRLEIFERELGPERRRLLDIGSGPGFFLKTAQTRGWQGVGIEPSRQAAGFARDMGLTIVEGFFGVETAPTLGRFDAIHLNNVLEHVPDPIGILSLAYGLLDAGGLICINVPNDFSPFQEAGRAAVDEHKWWIVPPHHLNYFDFSSATALLERIGFRIHERTTSFPMELFLLMGDNYIDNPERGRDCHNRRKRFDLNLEASSPQTRRAFYRALAAAGIGREAVLIAIRP
jgi:SAM-dependent methyltransferase